MFFLGNKWCDDPNLRRGQSCPRAYQISSHQDTNTIAECQSKCDSTADCRYIFYQFHQGGILCILYNRCANNNISVMLKRGRTQRRGTINVLVSLCQNFNCLQITIIFARNSE